MREISVELVKKTVEELCVKANLYLPDGMKAVSYTHLPFSCGLIFENSCAVGKSCTEADKAYLHATLKPALAVKLRKAHRKDVYKRQPLSLPTPLPR